MEYTEGPTLAEHNAAGRIPLEEALALSGRTGMGDDGSRALSKLR